MKKSGSVILTIVAALGVTARAQQRHDPCAATTFNEQACQAAVQNRGYCWNGHWVRMKYRYPYPYFYDSYEAYLEHGGTVKPAIVGSCGPTSRWFRSTTNTGSVAHGGFGSSSACHSAHS
jgi:hypothetical protein